MPQPNHQLVVPTRQLVYSMTGTIFPHEDVDVVLAVLDEYGIEPYELERERVQLAILKLSEGDVDKLLHYIRAAKQDYRDVLYWSIYPA